MENDGLIEHLDEIRLNTRHLAKFDELVDSLDKLTDAIHILITDMVERDGGDK